jgi:predicted transcriptional regulator of viral defense system
MKNRSLSLAGFLQTHPVFNLDELRRFLGSRGSNNPRTRDSLIRYHRQRGAILQIRRGIYCSVPPGISPEQCPIDSYALAAKLATDAVLAYHSALELHGRSYSVQERVVYLTLKSPAGSLFKFRGTVYRAVSPPTQLGRTEPGIQTLDRAGQKVRVTTLERTLVDLFDRPQLSGGWEEIWRSLETIPYLDLDQVVEYALRLRKSTTIARVGFYLAQHREPLMVEENHIQRLRRHRPSSPKYLTSKPTPPGRLVAEWNLIVPEAVLTKSWEEPA